MMKRPWQTMDEAVAATEEILIADPTRSVGDPTLPVYQFAAALDLEELRKRWEAEEPVILDAVARCASAGLIMPDWLAGAYLKAFRSVAHVKAGSWDEAFGAPFPKGAHLNPLRKRWEVRFSIFNRVRDLSQAGVPIDDAMFERVGREFGVGKTVASELYYQAKPRLPRK